MVVGGLLTTETQRGLGRNQIDCWKESIQPACEGWLQAPLNWFQQYTQNLAKKTGVDGLFHREVRKLEHSRRLAFNL